MTVALLVCSTGKPEKVELGEKESQFRMMGGVSRLTPHHRLQLGDWTWTPPWSLLALLSHL